MRQLFIPIFILVFFLCTGCGLIPLNQYQKMERQQRNTMEDSKEILESNNTQQDGEKEENDSKTNNLFENVKHSIAVVKSNPAQSTDQKNSVNSDLNNPKDQPPSKDDVNVGNEPNEPVDPLISDNGGTNNPSENAGNGEPVESDPKYDEAQKKADELKNTNQTVTVDESNLYDSPVESSTVLAQLAKGQNVHIGDTKVDKDDYEIWCYVTGNDGSKDFNGWISYSNLK